MIRITTLLTFSFIFLCFGEYASAQYPAPGTRPHSGVPVASVPGTTHGSVPAYIPQGSAYRPAPAYRPGYQPRYSGQTSIPVYQAPAYRPSRVYVPYTTQYAPAPVYVPSAPQYVPAPGYAPNGYYNPNGYYDNDERDYQRAAPRRGREEERHGHSDHGKHLGWYKNGRGGGDD